MTRFSEDEQLPTERCGFRHRGLAGVVRLLACGLTVATLIGCAPMGPQTADGGTGSEIVGKSEYPDSSGQPKILVIAAKTGLPVVLGRVFAYPQLRLPDTSWASSAALPRVSTDGNGGFIITDAPPGIVVVEVNDGSGLGVVGTVNVDQDSTRYDIGTLVVRQTGALSLTAQTSLPGRVRFYVGVKGTRLIVRGSQTGIQITLGDVPSGIVHTVNIRVFEPVYMNVDIPNVTVPPGVTTVLQTLQIQ